MSKLVKMTLAEALKHPVNAAEIARLKNIRDKDIDFTDAPEVTPEAIASGAVKIVAHGGVRRGAGRKPAGRVPITLRLRKDVAERLRMRAKELGKTMAEVAESHLAGV